MKSTFLVLAFLSLFARPSSAIDQYPNLGGVMDKAIRFQESFDPLTGVLAYDKEDGYLTFSVTGSVNTAVSGKYTLNYSTVDSATNTMSFARTITVLPQGSIAQCNATGRLGPQNIIELDSSYLGLLATNITFIKPVFDAPNDAVYTYKLIEYHWDGNTQAAGNPNLGEGHKVTPPSSNEWTAAASETFFKDLYICKKPRIDRWLKMTVSSNAQTNEWIYGLEGDLGVFFHSDYDNKDYYHLSEEVDDPQTVIEQFQVYSQAATYWCNFPIWLQKKMGCHAQVSTIAHLSEIPNITEKTERHGTLVTIRCFMQGGEVDKRSDSDANWANIKRLWDYGLSRSMNTSYKNSLQIFISEPKTDTPNLYMTKFAELYRHIRATYNPKRIYTAGANKGQFKEFKYFYDAASPYLKVSWHKGHFDTMLERFPWTLDLPYHVQYSRINEVWSHYDAAELFETHRQVHHVGGYTKNETAILDKMGILAQKSDGTWPEWTLMYQSMWFGYRNHHYLNNSLFFIDDWDGDGLSNQQEHALNTNPFNPDTDGDRVFDQNEIKWGMNPLNPLDAQEDWDGDRLSNYDEIIWTMESPGAGAGIGPTLPIRFTDESGTPRGMDINDPADGAFDPDQDLLPAWFEIMTRADPMNLYPQKDGDKTFQTNLDVAFLYLGMTKQLAYNYDLLGSENVDGDLISNITELVAGLDPKEASDSALDFDGDGLSNAAEIAAGTSFVGEDQTDVTFNASIIKHDAKAGASYTAPSLAWDVDAPDVSEVHEFQKLSGPAWLKIAPRGHLTGTPGGNDIGENLWSIQVSDGNGTTHTTTLRIWVAGSSPAEYYAAWATDNHLVQTNLLADPDGDQFVNLFEYAFGGNPQVSDATGGPWLKRIQIHGASNSVALTYPKRNDALSRGLSYTIETTDHIIDGIWSNKTYLVTGTEPLDNQFITITNRVQTDGNMQFYRLNIQMPPPAP